MTKQQEPTDPIGTVAELFAGVGGFRIGLARGGWRTIFSNQWEPSTTTQHASQCYSFNFGAEGHTNEDIEKVLDSYEAGDGKFTVPKTTLVVGGSPCQDYSVARTLSSAKGIVGKKGVLWWQIHRLLDKNRPPMVLLENVDRLLKSPASQRGRDFAIMLASLADLGYAAEWRVVNSADYGFPQRRKRVFIVARDTAVFPVAEDLDPTTFITKTGVLARALPVKVLTKGTEIISITLTGDLSEITEHFDPGGKMSPFRSGGVLVGRTAWTYNLESKFSGTKHTLGSILVPEDQVPEEFFVPPEQLKDWKYLKDAKKAERTHSSGATYTYSEGRMAFPDSTENASRTILTGEGGRSASRFKHIIKTPNGRHRRLMPIELERLSGFPDDWTRFLGKDQEASDVRRAFFVGNALVVGVVERIGKTLAADWQEHLKETV
jgi:DNA (cytosine-5)-methyltransferase 1